MNENWFEKIEEYLNGQMSRDEKLLFESEIASNEELSSLVSMYRTIETEMHADEKYIEQEALLKNTLNELKVAYFKIEFKEEEKADTKVIGVEEDHDFRAGSSQVKTIINWKSLAVAASITGIISLGIIWYFQPGREEIRIAGTNTQENRIHNIQQPDTTAPGKDKPAVNQDKPGITGVPAKGREVDVVKRETLYAANFQADAAPREKGGPLQEVFGYYETGEYKDAIEAFKNVQMGGVSRGAPDDKKLVSFYTDYYKGLSFMANDEVPKSIPSLENAVRISPDSFLRTKAEWYLSLAYLKTGEIRKAENILLKLSKNNQGGEYRQKATKLLSSLEKDQ